MAWKPGQSGNPGGRPKKLAAAQALCRRHTVKAVKTALELMDGKYGAKASDRQNALEFLMAYGWGKPVSPVNIGGDASGIVQVFIQKGLGDEPEAQALAEGDADGTEGAG